GITTFVYDDANRIKTSEDINGISTYIYDANGNKNIVIAPDLERTTYSWDFENQHTEIEFYDSGSSSYETIENVYNGELKRISQSQGSIEKKFVWDNENILLVTDDMDVTQYAFTLAPDEYGSLISQYDTSAMETSWHLYDVQGSTVALNDSSEVETDTYIYQAFGKLAASSGTTENNFTWKGKIGYWYEQEFDSDGGYYSIRRRDFESGSGRFLSEDPVRDDEENLYRYVRNNAVNFVDPSGLEVGQHWIVQSVFRDLAKQKIDDAAFELFEKFTTIPGIYNHGADTWFPDGQRFTHPQYNDAIKEWVDLVIKKKGKITEETAKEMIKMFTAKGFSKDAKKLYGLTNESFNIISGYRKGFFESIDLAEQLVKVGGDTLKKTEDLKMLVQYAQITSKYGNDEELIAKSADSKTLRRFKEIKKAFERTENAGTSKALRYLRKLGASNKTGWLSGLLGKAVGSRAARVLGPSVGVIFLAKDAWAGAAGEGRHKELTGILGAADNAAYNAMFGPEMEGTIETIIKSGGAPIGKMPSPGITRRSLQRGVSAFPPSIISGNIDSVSHEKDVPDVVPEKKYESNWFWRLLGYD
ncbi:MAG: RHS repeat-associated core domain-containing protein, partial [Planctomycetota bacterium]